MRTLHCPAHRQECLSVCPDTETSVRQYVVRLKLIRGFHQGCAKSATCRLARRESVSKRPEKSMLVFESGCCLTPERAICTMTAVVEDVIGVKRREAEAVSNRVDRPRFL